MWSGDRSALSGDLQSHLLRHFYTSIRIKGDRFLFLTGTLLGGAYEYLCSVFTELVFGKVFWDYSKIPFNLGGRINLLYCFSGELLQLYGLNIISPVEKWIEKIPAVAGKLLTWFFISIYGLQYSGILCGTGKI